ncbi:MAG: permease prefix domain 1-containing protein [Oscillospiraceae bacterium]|nr:permease prefix domain 1-containing protein [Oscillospiraceae bacterium]
MIEKIKSHLDDLFDSAPKTRQVADMYQELLAGCLDKYTDLTSGGMDEREAYEKVIGGIGDVDELLGYVERKPAFDPIQAEEKRKKRAVFSSMGICGFFIAVAAFLLFAFGGRQETGLILFIFIAGMSTMALIYGRMSTVFKYEKADDTLVEEMKEQMTAGKSGNKMASLASSTLWAVIVAAYLAVSFMSGRWDITWIVFPFAGALQNVVMVYFQPRDKMKYIIGAFWCLVVTIYFAISFGTFSWHITWLIFPIAVAAQQAVKLFMFWRDEK